MKVLKIDENNQCKCKSFPENFGDEILEKISKKFSETKYEITEQTVLEELLWCYKSGAKNPQACLFEQSDL